MNGQQTQSFRWARRFRTPALATFALVLGAGLAQPILAQDGIARPPREPQAAPEDGPINFGRFSEPIALDALVDFISRTLDINIVLSDADLSGRLVEFRAPVTIERDKLLPMLETFLAQHSLGLTETSEGLIMIAPANNLPPQPG